MVNNIIRSKYIFVEKNKIEILFSNYIFALTFQIPSLELCFPFVKCCLAILFVLDSGTRGLDTALPFMRNYKTAKPN